MPSFVVAVVTPHHRRTTNSPEFSSRQDSRKSYASPKMPSYVPHQHRYVLTAWCSPVKFRDPRTLLACDVNVNERLGLFNSDLSKACCGASPLLRPMLLLIKLCAKPLGLNNPSPMTKEPGALVAMLWHCRLSVSCRSIFFQSPRKPAVTKARCREKCLLAS